MLFTGFKKLLTFQLAFPKLINLNQLMDIKLQRMYLGTLCSLKLNIHIHKFINILLRQYPICVK